MRNILFSLFLAILLPLGMMAQSVTLTFTGKDANNNRVQLDRVSITNLTKGWQETIYWPDTTLTMQNSVDIDDYSNNGEFTLSQNNPNPFNGTTDVLLSVADAGTVTLEITDVNGRIVETQNFASLQVGLNQFRITLSAAGTYVMTARQNGKSSSIKMVNNGGGNGNVIEYAGIVRANDYSPQQPKSHTRGTTANPFNYGDWMEYVGYATFEGEEYESVLISQPQGPTELAFELSFPSFHSSIVPLLMIEQGWVLSDFTCPDGYGVSGITDIYLALENAGGYECDDIMFFRSDGNEYVNYGNVRYDIEPSGTQFIGTWALNDDETILQCQIPAFSPGIDDYGFTSPEEECCEIISFEADKMVLRYTLTVSSSPTKAGFSQLGTWTFILTYVPAN